MANKYLVEHASGAEIVVEIDHGVVTEARLHELNNFWIDPESRLADEDGNVLHAVLKLLAERVLTVQFNRDLNVQGVVDAFDYDDIYGGEEGFPKLDGSAGIKLLSVSGLNLEPWDMDIKEVSDGPANQ